MRFHSGFTKMVDSIEKSGGTNMLGTEIEMRCVSRRDEISLYEDFGGKIDAMSAETDTGEDVRLKMPFELLLGGD